MTAWMMRWSNFPSYVKSAVPRFNQGGLMGGLPGIDSNLAALTRGEFVVREPVVRANLPQIESLNRTGQWPSGNEEVVRELRAVKKELEDIKKGQVRADRNNVAVTLDAAGAVVQAEQKTGEKVDGLGRSMQLQAEGEAARKGRAA